MSLNLEQSQQMYGTQIAELTEKVKQSVAEGDYVSAKQFQAQLDQAKAALKSDNTAFLLQEHQQIVQSINEAYADEERNFNATWEKRLDEFNTNAAHRLDALKAELQEKLAELDSQFVGKPPRFSSQLINLREQEIRLAKGGKFDQAQAVQAYADQVEQREMAQHQQATEVQKEQQKLEIFRFYEKQGKVLMGKIEAGRADILNKWAGDMDKLEKHHEAMLKAESNRFLTVKNSKRGVAEGSRLRRSDIVSPVKQYIEGESANVNASQLGASMSPVTSRVMGLGRLRNE